MFAVRKTYMQTISWGWGTKAKFTTKIGEPIWVNRTQLTANVQGRTTSSILSVGVGNCLFAKNVNTSWVNTYTCNFKISHAYLFNFKKYEIAASKFFRLWLIMKSYFMKCCWFYNIFIFILSLNLLQTTIFSIQIEIWSSSWKRLLTQIETYLNISCFASLKTFWAQSHEAPFFVSI